MKFYFLVVYGSTLLCVLYQFFLSPLFICYLPCVHRKNYSLVVFFVFSDSIPYLCGTLSMGIIFLWQLEFIEILIL